MAKNTREIDDPAIAFLQTLWALDHRLQSHSKRMRSRIGVTGAQRLVLRLIALYPKSSPSDLARILHFHKSTVTVILRSLEHAKMVKRTPNPDDARAVVLALTSRGEAIAKQRTGTVESAVRTVLGKQRSADVRVARRVLEAVALGLG
jgi:DNA-binding MarR family transcriptional regulator